MTQTKPPIPEDEEQHTVSVNMRAFELFIETVSKIDGITEKAVNNLRSLFESETQPAAADILKSALPNRGEKGAEQGNVKHPGD